MIFVLSVLLAITTTGWFVTATRERSAEVAAPVPVPTPAPSPSPVVPAPIPAPPSEPPIKPVAAEPELIDVLVAAKDLPVGWMLTREDLNNEKNPVIKVRKVPRDGLPPVFVANKDELIDKRLTRSVRVDETFNPNDLTRGGAIILPDGHDMVSLQINVGNAAAGFIGPGSRVNVLATMRIDKKLYAFPLLVNMLVVAVDTATTYEKSGVFPTLNMVSFAVTEKQALLLALAKNRGCTLELLLRHPTKSADADKDYDIDKVIKLLSDEPGREVPRPEPVPEPGAVAPAPRSVGEPR